SDEDCSDVEILGWLYQFYISERKDQVMARKSAVPTEDIPAVTQLFTPHWIVRYLVENSLGRLWLLNRPGSRLREHMPYYIEGNNAPGGSPTETDFLKITKPEEIRVCDPAVGSGHMLTYAFDLLTLIYEEEGYAPTEIPALILRHNLHGLEICPRAAQLAELALVFKAREKSRRFFQPEHIVRPSIIELKEIRFEEGELPAYFKALGIDPSSFIPHTSAFPKLLHQFEEAKNFGSLIQPCLDERTIAEVRRAIEGKDLGGQLFLRETHLKVLRVLEQAEALTQRYHVVVANPPYMGSGNMNVGMKGFVNALYPEAKQDLMTCFIVRESNLTVKCGYFAMINLPSWLFILSFEELRKWLVTECEIKSLLHLGRGIFGSDFGSVAFVLKNSAPTNHPSVFRRLFTEHVEVDSVEEKERKFLTPSLGRFIAHQRTFMGIPGAPIAYWLSERFLSVFERAKSLGEVVKPRAGMSTGCNERFILSWHEVSLGAVGFNQQATSNGYSFYPHNKAGGFRRWYGNTSYILRYNQSALNEMEAWPGFRHDGQERYFRPSVSWGKVTAGSFSARHYPPGFTFDSAGLCLFPENPFHFLGLLNSNVFSAILAALSQTMNFTVGDIARFPVLTDTPDISEAARKLVSLSRADWDNFETSWDFRDQPLLRPGLKGATLEASWRNWEAQSTAAIRRMQELETENNRLFIAAYGLDGELQPEVPEEQITLARADARRDMAAFLSYAVGCMMGRYSPDHPGLILADAGASLRDFLEKVEKPLAELTFAPDEDSIIPVLDGEWFEDDIVARTRDFLRATFGAAHLDANVAWLEKALNKDLRKYFVRDFYKDHLSNERAYGYKKRPIYWLVSSPAGSFQALLYLHRYTRDTVNTVLNSYLREFIHKLDARLKHLGQVDASSTNAREKTAARKEADKLRKSLKECQEWEREVVLPLAQQRIELDLDNGVKVNYLKFPGFLAKIPGLEKKEKE
ncbi:MAG: BREX-1 system adenine-specific DNA-methyltransferase PglX, partial [Blastocatellia bacterium]|nr:BREX-1 system adenine-specific DNA-methyltransferase PglX [Blastocatellia bacterium]